MVGTTIKTSAGAGGRLIMENSGRNAYQGEITEYLRSRCIGFQRGAGGLVTVIESLVRSKGGAPTLVYQLRSADGASDCVLDSRPRIDIPPPPRLG